MRRSVVLALALTAGGCAAIFGPSYRPAPPLQVKPTAETVERGRYLAHHVALCVHCHTERAIKVFSMPPKGPIPMGGGDCFGEVEEPEKPGYPIEELPGYVCMPNITNHPAHGVGAWSDGELARAIREGVDNEDNTLFPFMPYPAYRNMSDRDVEAVVAYIRTASVSDIQTPPTDINWPVSAFVKGAPEPIEEPVPHPDPSSGLAYGEYLVAIAGCSDCHTPGAPMSLDEDAKFSGGDPLHEMPGVVSVYAANITPHKETGIGSWSKAQFVGRFKAFEDASSLGVVPPERQTIMPWSDYAGMTEADLGAIYDYLMSVPPIDNKVVTFHQAEKMAKQSGMTP